MLAAGCLFLLAPAGEAGAVSAQKVSTNRLSGRILNMCLKDDGRQTIIRAWRNSEPLRYETRTLDSPPRIVVDILSRVRSFKTIQVPVMSRNVADIRIGYHPGKIRLALVLKPGAVFRHRVSKSGGMITIRIGTPVSPRGGHLLSASPGSEPENRTCPVPPAAPASHPDAEPDGTKGPAASIAKAETPLIPVPPDDDGRGDTRLFREGLDAYRAGEWRRAERSFSFLVRRYPKSRFGERAAFLLAASCEKRYADSLSSHFERVKYCYEQAMERYPRSPFVSEALFSLGNICFRIGSHVEALGYYNLLIKRGGNGPILVRALIRKARILRMKERREAALGLLEKAVARSGRVSDRIEATAEMAEILYEMNAFRKSVKVLSALIRQYPESIYRYPRISLCLGRDYYELGDVVMARRNLFRYFNILPGGKAGHMVLTKIGDTYREEGRVTDAVKIYELVLDRYPGTEGARISMIRLAEEKEAGRIRKGETAISPDTLVREKIGRPKEIYEGIIEDGVEGKKESPLTQLALVKLAILYQKEGRYEQSLETLKELLSRYPRTALVKEARYAIEKTLDAMLKREAKKGDDAAVMDLYRREKALFRFMDSPGPFLTLARACIRLKREETALSMFRRADGLLLDGEKPADLLFSLARDQYRRGMRDAAVSRFRQLIANYPADRHTPLACRMVARFLMEKKKYAEAVKMFSVVLSHPLADCEKAGLLVRRADALAGIGKADAALGDVTEADRLKDACAANRDLVCREIGNLYLRLNHPEKAADRFKEVADTAGDRTDRILYGFKAARCYCMLKRKAACLALYRRIWKLNEPFWSDLAREKMDELEFDEEILKGRK